MPASPRQPSTRRAISRRKRWLFRSLAVLLSLAVLGGLEVTLRVSGVGIDLSLIRAVPNAQTLRFQINTDADRVWCPGQGLAGPEPRRFDLPRPTGTFRIVVVGASTVQGFPYASALAFPRQLELLLNLQQSRQRVEVLNLGVTGISSAVVREILAESLKLQPDLIVVHAGHNEFYGVGGVASNVGPVPPLVVKASAAMSRTRIFQSIAHLLPSAIPEDRDPIEALPADLDIPLTSPLVASAETAYRSNLEAMVQTARGHGVPVILSTVAANCRSHSPVSRFLPDGLSDGDLSRWRNAFDGGRKLAADGDFAAALEQFETSQSISGDSSLLQYRRAECLLALGRTAAADDAFRLAADLDGCRFRAPSSFGQIVSDVASHWGDDGVVVVDTANTVRNKIESADPLADDLPVFLEHVHYSRRGHGIVAEALAREILNRFFDTSWNDSIATGSATFSDQLGALIEDDVAALSFALEVYSREPMQNSFDVQRHQQMLAQRVSARFAGMSQEAQKAFSSLTMEQMAADLPMHLADQIEQTEDRRMLDILRRAAIRQPWSVERCQRLIQALKSSAKTDASLESELELQLKQCHEISTHSE